MRTIALADGPIPQPSPIPQLASVCSDIGLLPFVCLAPGSFAFSGNMSVARATHTATVLNDGTVLITGGYSDTLFTALSTAELYDPISGTFSAVGNMTAPLAQHTATLLNNGKVLIAGNGFNCGCGTAMLYDPATRSFAPTGSMSTARRSFTATRLADGRVLVVGGADGNNLITASAELYDPATGIFTSTGSMHQPRWYHTATLLPDGKVLIAGGGSSFISSNSATLASAELYDPATGQFSVTGNMNRSHQLHTATLLNNGLVLIAGGFGQSSVSLPNPSGVIPKIEPLSSEAELYFPSLEAFVPAQKMVSNRSNATATLLNDGKVLIAGGDNGVGTAEIYDPTTGAFAPSGNLTTYRQFHTASLLVSGPKAGRVLIAGGTNNTQNQGGELSSTELFSE